MADINARIRLDGEAQFKRQMTEAKTAVKGLDDQMKLAEAQFEQTGDAQELMRQKSQLLNQKLDAQKRAVDAAREALRQCAEQGLDPASAKVQEWKGKLAQAETRVIEITGELRNNEQGLDRTGRAYTQMGGKVGEADEKVGSLAESLQNVDRGVSWQNVNTAIQNINTAIDNGIKKAVQMGRALWEMTSDSTAWADELATRSVTTGLSTDTLQQWDYAARFIDTDVDAIIGAMNRMTRSMDSDTLANYGIETRTATGELRDAQDVMWDALEAIGRIDNETERNAAAMELFGKSAAELTPLIQAGREEWERIAEGAPIVSEENIQKLTTANDALEDLDARLETTKNTLLAQLAPALTTIASSLSTALQSLGEYLDTEEGQQKLQDFSNAAVRLAESIFDIDWGAALDAASTALTGITDALNWIVDNKELVLAALGALAAARIWGVISSAAANTGQLVNGVRTLLGRNGGGNTGGTAGAATGGTATAAAAGGSRTAAVTRTVTNAVKTALTGAGTSLGSAAGLSSTGMGALGAAGLGGILGMAGVIGTAKLAMAGNRMSSQAYDLDRYAGDPMLPYIMQAAYAMAHGGSSADALHRLGIQSGSASGFVDLFNYTDTERGAANYLQDLLSGTDWQHGDNQQLMASIYRVFASIFGGHGSAGYDAALAELPAEVAEAIRYGATMEQQRKQAGAAADDTYLDTYMTEFFARHGITGDESAAGGVSAATQAAIDAAAMGATTATWQAAERIIHMELTRPEPGANSGNGSSQAADVAGVVAAALNGATVEMDGTVVGRLVAPTVSAVLARESIGR